MRATLTRSCQASVLSILVGSAPAMESSPRVLSPHVADAWSLRTFAEFPRWKDLEGDAKVLAIYEYLSDRRTGLYPMGAGAWEGDDVLYEYGFSRDPVKMINVHPMGYCDMLGPTAAGIFEGMGVGRARTVSLPGLSHVFAEVEVAGRWAYVDLDLRAVFRKPDGTLASTEDARRDPTLWAGPTGPTFFPVDGLEGLRKAYAASPVEHRYGVHTGGHTMSYALRRGETFVRWWKPQGDRWLHHPSFHESLRGVLERDPPGPKCKHGEAYTVHTRGNGRFVWAPDLTDRSPDFDDGVHESANVRPGPEGLTLVSEGEGHATFEVRSPYVIVPRVGRYETPDDDRDASVVEVEGRGLGLRVSVDGGSTWVPVPVAAGPIDLTRHASGRYGYLLRADLEGKPREAVLRKISIATWVQVHPASLPALRRGRNVLRYVTGDHHGLPTRVLEIRPNGSRRDDFLRRVVVPPKDYDPGRTTARVRGSFVVRVDPLPGCRIAWFSAGASFATHQGEAAASTRSSIAWSVGEPTGFREVHRSAIPTDQAHWHTNADVEVRLAEPASVLFVRYVGDPALNNYRIFAHCLEERPRPGGRVTVVQAWRERGEMRSRRVELPASAVGARSPVEAPSWEIVCEDEPEDESIEISVEGGRR